MPKKRKCSNVPENSGGGDSRKKSHKEVVSSNETFPGEEDADNRDDKSSRIQRGEPSIAAGGEGSAGNCDPRKKAIFLPRAGPIKYVRLGLPVPKFPERHHDSTPKLPHARESRTDAIFIGIKDRSGQEEVFCLKKTVRMEGPFDRYASKRGATSGSLRFSVRGKEVGPGDTSETLGFENVGHIDCRERTDGPPIEASSPTKHPPVSSTRPKRVSTPGVQL